MNTPTFTEEEKKQRQPVPTVDLIRYVLGSYWNITPTSLKSLASYDDANYYVEDNGKKYLIKIYNAVESANTSLLEGYSVLLNHIHKNMPELDVPIPIPYVKNNNTDLIDNKLNDVVYINTCPTVGNNATTNNHLVAIRLFQWVCGETLSSVLQNETETNINTNTLAAQLFSELGYKLGLLRYCIDNNYTGPITRHTETYTTDTNSISNTNTISNTIIGRGNTNVDHWKSESSCRTETRTVRLLTHPSFVGRLFNWDIRQFALVEPYFKYLVNNGSQGSQGSQGIEGLGSGRDLVGTETALDGDLDEDVKRYMTIMDIYNAYNQDLVPVDHLFEYGTIMGDCNDANVIVGEKTAIINNSNIINNSGTTSTTGAIDASDASDASDRNKYISGIIDFGDSIYTYAINEIVIAIAYGLLSTYGLENPKELIYNMVLQYCMAMIAAKTEKHEIFNINRILTHVEISHFRLLISIRLATSVTIGHYSIVKNPENAPYLRLHAIPARRAINYIWNVLSHEEMVCILKDAMTAATAAGASAGHVNAERIIPTNLETHRLKVTCPPTIELDQDIASLLSHPQTMKYLTAMSKLEDGGWTVEETASRRQYCVEKYLDASAWMGNMYLKSTLLKSDCKIYSQYPATQTQTDIATTATTEKTDVFVGISGFRDIDYNNRSAEMGIILHSNYQRMGLCAEMHYIGLTYGFEVMHLNRITFITTTINTPMIHFLENVCMATLEGIKKEFFFKQNNNIEKGVLDAACYCILASDWEKYVKMALIKYLKSH